MTPERWQRVSDLLEEAFKREPYERAAFLDQVCAGDEALRGEVESFLESDREAGRFIESPAVEAVAPLFTDDKTELLIGERIGPYKMLSLIGAGGMGQVYLAEDSRLGRRVALKVLTECFTREEERVRRFQQEARAAGLLNHPNILIVHDIGTHENVPYIVSELLEGQTLRGSLDAGRPPVHEALEFALQIAHGLGAAHAAGIVHRDLKPENLFVTKDGRVKILDFGLAKLRPPKRREGEVTGEPLTSLQTNPGVVMGTTGYMSPEQAQGQEIDHRSDIFSFGVILYEMLSGQRPFEGASAAEVMSAILRDDPPALVETDSAIPPALDRVVRHCLEKKPDARFQSMSDVAFNLEGLSDSAVRVPAAPLVASGQRERRERLGWIVAAVAVLATVATLAVAYFRRPPVEGRSIRSFILAPEESSLLPPRSDGGPAISPDGTRLAFVATTKGRGRLLWVRSLDAVSARALAGTEDARNPFWSPEGRFIGFFADKKLKKIEASGGPQITLCDVQSETRGGAWNRDGVIIFAPSTAGTLYRVPASGGVPSPVTQLNEARGEVSHTWPYFLPDGQHFLYLTKYDSAVETERDGIYVASLESNESKPLLRASCKAVYGQGYLLFLLGTTLMAQPFDAKRLETAGDPLLVAEQILFGHVGSGFFTVSEDGILAYQTGPVGVSQLTWFDRMGHSPGVLGDQARQGDPRLSPDGKMVMVTILDPKTRNRGLWLYELARGLRTRFTLEPSEDRAPVWSPDGRRIVFTSDRQGHWDLYQKASSGTGSEERLLESQSYEVPFSWSPDGRFLLYRPFDPKTSWDLWILPMSNDSGMNSPPGEPFPFVRTGFHEMGGEFSPDGRWIAFQSDESGRQEMYVAPFPGPGGKRRISTAGGQWPKWRGDGREIFYLAADDKLMAAEVRLKGATLEVGAVRALFITRPFDSGYTGYPYDVTRDGERFLVNTAVETGASSPITLVINWMADLKK
ncbi:MAG: PD40 domain-containing protein [Acidobacteria bacterium]|nr:PD40 domain-containing protein [Acidobacteriota bacterium]